MLINVFPRLVFGFFALKSCQWSLMSLITGNKVKKNTQVKVLWKRKGQSQQNNGLVKPSCGIVVLYGPFGFFLDMADYPWIILAEVCKLKYSITKWGGVHYAWSSWNLNSKEKVNGIFLSKTLNVLQSLKYIFWSTKC